MCLRCCVVVQILADVRERLEAAEKTIASWAEDKPWINENETKSAVEKVRRTHNVMLGIPGCGLASST